MFSADEIHNSIMQQAEKQFLLLLKGCLIISLRTPFLSQCEKSRTVYLPFLSLILQILKMFPLCPLPSKLQVLILLFSLFTDATLYCWSSSKEDPQISRTSEQVCGQFFLMRVVKHWVRLRREAGESPCLEICISWLDKAFSNLLYTCRYPCFKEEVGLKMSWTPFNPTSSLILILLLQKSF